MRETKKVKRSRRSNRISKDIFVSFEKRAYLKRMSKMMKNTESAEV